VSCTSKDSVNKVLKAFALRFSAAVRVCLRLILLLSRQQLGIVLLKQDMAPQKPLTPVHFFSHGSTMMLGEESESANYWKACGDAALANGIEHVIMMVNLYFRPQYYFARKTNTT